MGENGNIFGGVRATSDYQIKVGQIYVCDALFAGLIFADVPVFFNKEFENFLNESFVEFWVSGEFLLIFDF